MQKAVNQCIAFLRCTHLKKNLDRDSNAPYVRPHPEPHQKRKYEAVVPLTLRLGGGVKCGNKCGKLDSCVYKCKGVLKDVTVLGPYSLIYTVAKVSRFFGTDGLVALASLVLLELAL